MKILITGEPRTGKSTLIKKLISLLPDWYGFYAEEVKENNERIGFDVVDSNENKVVLARTNVKTNYPFYRYFINLEGFERFLKNLSRFEPQETLIIDEIGPMELFSKKFIELSEKYIKSSNTFIGTVKLENTNEYISKVKNYPKIILVTLTLENREKITVVLTAFVKNFGYLQKLNNKQQTLVQELVKKHLQANNFIQLEKLFNHSLKYVVEKRVVEKDPGIFEVTGDHGSYQVSNNQCTCDLFLGKGNYKNKAGECSHIMAVKIATE